MVILLVLVLLVVAVLVVSGVRDASKRSNVIGDAPRISMERYVTGFPAVSHPVGGVICAVKPEDFVFLGGSGWELGRIPRGRLDNVVFEDRSQITRRLTVTRIATLGLFSLAVPKKQQHSESWVTVEWTDSHDVRQTTVFQFAGTGAEGRATKAVHDLKRHVIMPPAPKLKKCPYCAEMIKAEAIRCRYCQADLADLA